MESDKAGGDPRLFLRPHLFFQESYSWDVNRYILSVFGLDGTVITIYDNIWKWEKGHRSDFLKLSSVNRAEGMI